MKNLILIATFLTSSAIAQTPNWELNDVSYLMSLPTTSDSSNFLLKPSSRGIHGTLLPTTHESFLKDIVTDLYDSPDNDFQVLRAVAMRVDPCFQFKADPTVKCASVLRIVWQPLNLKTLTTYDAAVHTFYKLTDLEFKALKTKLQDLKKKNLTLGITTEARPLNIHPAFENSSRRNTFNSDLQKIILSTVGEKKLVRFTVMKQMTRDLWWQFLGREKVGPIWKDMQIPRLREGDTTIDFFNDEFTMPLGMRGSYTPSDRKFTSDDLTELIRGPDIKNDEYDIKALKSGLKAINRIENPRIHAPATMDCMHCHITEPTRVWAEHVAPKLVKQFQTTEGLYVQTFGRKHNLSNPTVSKKNNKSLRAFGYFGSTPSINQRTINESAAVAEDLNKI